MSSHRKNASELVENFPKTPERRLAEKLAQDAATARPGAVSETVAALDARVGRKQLLRGADEGQGGGARDAGSAPTRTSEDENVLNTPDRRLAEKLARDTAVARPGAVSETVAALDARVGRKQLLRGADEGQGGGARDAGSAPTRTMETHEARIRWKERKLGAAAATSPKVGAGEGDRIAATGISPAKELSLTVGSVDNRAGEVEIVIAQVGKPQPPTDAALANAAVGHTSLGSKATSQPSGPTTMNAKSTGDGDGEHHGSQMQVEAIAVNASDMEASIRRHILEDAVVAGAVRVEEGYSGPKSRRKSIGIFLAVVLLVGISVGISVGLTRRNGVKNDTLGGGVENAAPTKPPAPLLETLTQRGALRCGVWKDAPHLFEVDFCAAIAAAALGLSYHLETVPLTPAERFPALVNGSIDLLVAMTTHTFERDVHQRSAGVGFSFSVPYLYTGIVLGGVAHYVDCAERNDFLGNCTDLKVCVIDGTTRMWNLEKRLPGPTIVAVNGNDEMYEGLNNGLCNVISGDTLDIAEVVVREKGYSGPYWIGNSMLSKTPYAIATRDTDPQWSDFVNWVLQALLKAEEQNVTQRNAEDFMQDSPFGLQYRDMFRNAIAAVGNYGEIYARSLQPFVPRQDINLLNKGDTGLIYSHPFGQLQSTGPGPIKDGKLDRIKQRGYLVCGVTNLNQSGFGKFDVDTDKWSGLDVDFCHALSASIFQGQANSVVYEGFHESRESFLALANGHIDILPAGKVDIFNDVNETSSRQGFSFSQPYFYSQPGEGSSDGKAFAMATQQDDIQWSSFVYWIVTSTFYAEEEGIGQMTSNEMPVVNLFGSGFSRMFRDAIFAVGNYGEMYDRNVGPFIARGGRNLLNAPPFSPQHYPLPFPRPSSPPSL